MAGQADVKERLFHAALELADPAQRAAFLDAACAGDAGLRAEIDELMKHDAEGGSFMKQPALPRPTATTDGTPAERPGTMIGRYKLLELVGEGGMGAVWVAEQTEPVRRKVALKVIKAGMDSKSVLARFEAERQALALMDHPNIAKVLDGGLTETGRPFFVMEYVKGVPITEYCDAARLSVAERLNLFVQVCQAVQHAHQKGIIHRDLKPSNILVAPYDDKPVPKVIDFGLAKAMHQSLTERTLHTAHETVLGTPLYMSPEQAQLNNLDVDTRSDIYSLGVLLYELLTGTTPLEKRRFKEAAWDEVRRLIREEEPPRPSTRLSSTQTLPSLAACRQTEPGSLTKLVRGELDWIVMKALDKDRTRRYETANGFAMDLQRYLAGEAVLAVPPSAGYRLRKFARRNKRALATAALLSVMLLVAIGAVAGSIGWTVRDREARRAKVAAELELLLEEVKQRQGEQKWHEALATARRAEALVAGGGGDAALERRVQEVLTDLNLVQRLENIRLAQAEQTPAQGDRAYAAAFRDGGVDLDSLTEEEAAQLLRARVRVTAALVAALDQWFLCRLLSENDPGARALVAVLQRLDPDPLRRQVREAICREDFAALERLAASPDLGRQPPLTLLLVGGILCLKPEKAEQGIAVLREAQRRYPGDLGINVGLGVCLQKLGPDHRDESLTYFRAALALRPDATWSWFSIGVSLHYHHKKLDEAIGYYRRALELDPKNAEAYYHLGNALREQKKFPEAVACYHKVIELEPKKAGAHHELGRALSSLRKFDEAAASYQKAIELNPKNHWSHHGLGTCLRELKKLDEAMTCWKKAIELEPSNAQAHNSLGNALREQKKLNEAVVILRKAIDLNPKNAQAHNNLGNALREQEKLDEAIACFRRAIAIDPKYSFAHDNLGLALAAQRKFDEAIVCHQKAIELNPKYHWSHFRLAASLGELKRLDEASASYSKAIELAPQSPNAYIDLGRALRARKRHDEAIISFKKAVELDPRNAEAHNSVGHVLRDQDKFDEAIAVYKKSIEVNPNHASAHYNLGLAYDAQKKTDEAIACYRKAIEHDPNNASPWHRPHFHLGVALVNQDKLDEAIPLFRRAIELNPKLAEAHANLCWHLATAADVKLRDPQGAVAHARQALELQPNVGNHWSNLGVALLRAGEPKAAAQALEKADQMWKDGDDQHRFFLAMAYWHIGEKDKARQAYDQGAAWMDKHQPMSDEQRRFRAEAAEMIMIEKKQ